MLVMPFVYKVFRFNLLGNLAIALIVPYGLEVAFHSVPNYESITAIHDLFSCVLYFPCFLVGYLMAQHQLIERINRKINLTSVGALIGMVAVLAVRYIVAWLNINTFGFLLDVFYAPVFVYFATNVFTGIGKCKAVQNIFSMLGRYSTGMWFFHAVFFSTYVCDIFQPILLLVKWPVLMFVWLVLLSLAGAFIYQKLLDGIKSVPGVLKRSS
jgi:hypothetical protein